MLWPGIWDDVNLYKSEEKAPVAHDKPMELGYLMFRETGMCLESNVAWLKISQPIPAINIWVVEGETIDKEGILLGTIFDCPQGQTQIGLYKLGR